MRKLLRFLSFSLVFVLVSGSALPQESPKAQTKIEQLFLAKGSLLIKEFYSLDKKGLPSTVSFNWIILREVGKEAKEVKGLKVEVVDYSRTISNSESVFLDAEEVSELISALDYLINLSNQYKAQPPITHSEAQFSTKGDFFVGIYYDGKDMKAFISAGRVGRVNSFFNVDKLPDVKALIEEAIQKFMK